YVALMVLAHLRAPSRREERSADGGAIPPGEDLAKKAHGGALSRTGRRLATAEIHECASWRGERTEAVRAPDLRRALSIPAIAPFHMISRADAERLSAALADLQHRDDGFVGSER